MAKRPKRRRKRKVVNRLAVLEGRKAGKSYAVIAAEQRISPSGAFYSANPRKRKRSVARVDGLARSIWISDRDWEGVRTRARAQQITMAEWVRRLIQANIDPAPSTEEA